jgi:ribulose kinase
MRGAHRQHFGLGRRRCASAGRQLLADATGLPVEITACPEPVLLGSAMLAAVAAGTHADLQTAMASMSSVAGRNAPTGGHRPPA